MIMALEVSFQGSLNSVWADIIWAIQKEMKMTRSRMKLIYINSTDVPRNISSNIFRLVSEICNCLSLPAGQTKIIQNRNDGQRSVVLTTSYFMYVPTS